MNTLQLKIITPEKLIFDKQVEKISCQTTEGEVVILPRHTPLLTLLADGVITITSEGLEEYFSAGSGYLETDGKEVRILISQAFGQKELNETRVLEAEENAKKLLKENLSAKDRERAFSMLRRASVDLKVLNKVKKRR